MRQSKKESDVRAYRIVFVLSFLLASLLVISMANATTPYDGPEKWEYSCRQRHIIKWFSDAELAGFDWQRESGKTIIIEEHEIEEFKKMFQEIKKCDALHKCFADRAQGKVKKFRYNDRRWR